MDGNGNGKRAVLYARTSGDDRGKGNLEAQLEMCQEHAEGAGLRVVARLAEDDRGASGASFDLPKLGEALELAEGGQYDVLVVRELDRLSRTLAKQLVIEEALRRHGVKVQYCLASYEDTPEGRLSKHVRATVAEYEREKITERMTRGRRNKVKSGSVLVSGNPPYGYEVREDGDGFALVVHEAEAKVVRWIFTLYIHEGLSILSIADKLEGVPSYADTRARASRKQRKYGQWNASTVHRILTNETYAGVWHYGKRRRKKGGAWQVHGDGHRLAVQVPAVVSRETWEAAQEQRAKNRTNARRNVQHQYLMGKRVKCGTCGLKVQGTGFTKADYAPYLYYVCPASKGAAFYARECDAPSFRAGEVDDAVWEWVRSFVTDPEALDRGLRKHQAERDRENEPLRARVAVVDDLLVDNRRQLERLLDLYLAGDFPRDVLTDRKARLEQTIESLEGERAELAAVLEAAELSDAEVVAVKELVAKVALGLEEAEEDFDLRRGVVEALNVWAKLTVEGGEKVVRASCILSPEEVVLGCVQDNKLA